jgi:hypothetical protein
MRVVQFKKDGKLFAAKVVDANTLQVIQSADGVFGAAVESISQGVSLKSWIEKNLTDELHSYASVIEEGQLTLPVFHPNPNECLVAGTGLTHLGSADTRDAMHHDISNTNSDEMTDSMKMFKLGLDGGKPKDGEEGSQPEWFYKGDGHTLVDPGADFPVPGFALDAGEEPELVGIYIIGQDRKVYRVGFAVGNEFSDHVTEQGNYLWLAHSKLRFSSFGPELLIGDAPENLKGKSKIYRDDKVIWEKEFLTGESNMSHSIANLEHHHFKYQQFCQPGQMHVHFFGTSTLSFGDGIKTEDNDVFEISIPEFGQALKNKIKIVKENNIVSVKPL